MRRIFALYVQNFTHFLTVFFCKSLDYLTTSKILFFFETRIFFLFVTYLNPAKSKLS